MLAIYFDWYYYSNMEARNTTQPLRRNKMSAHHTHAQIAEDFKLWGEFFDTGAEMTEAEFDALSIEEKITMQVEAFGHEAEAIGDDD
jgi:hypothetical protein